MRTAGKVRAAGITVAAAAGVLLLATHRPGPLVAGPDDPTSGVVGAAAWVAWALAGYLAAGVGAAAAGHLARGTAGPGRVAVLAAHATPGWVRRLVELAVGASTVAVVMAGAAPVAAYADPPPPSAAAASSLDWPGLAAPTPIAATAPAAVALVSSHPRRHGDPRAEIVVRAGDSLWTLAARRLGPGASGAEIAAAWPRLYAANRAVIGPDPDLLHPGQRLVPPAADPRSPR